jgi:hypothetical protein
VPDTDAPRGHRWGWAGLLLATAVAIAGFWAAGSSDSDSGSVGILAVPLYWAAAYLTTWRAVPLPPVALVAGVALGGSGDSNDNEFAWINYAGGLLICEAAVVWGAASRRRARRRATNFDHPERPN